MKKLEWLEAMRGVAACWVLLHHSALAARDFAGWGGLQALTNGYLGVDFFFVLSGFIIAHSSEQLTARGGRWRDYASARALRIYVPYLPIGVAMLVALAAFPSLSSGARGEVSTWTSLTLLPANAPPALSVAWTLVHEICFYAIFSLFFVSRAVLVAFLGLWVTAILGAWIAGLDLPLAARYLLSPLNLCFVLGVLIEWSTRGGVSNRLAAVAAVSGLGLVAAQALASDPNRAIVALGFCGLVAASRSPRAMSISPGAALLYLGAASYSIYLLHNPAISVAVRALRGAPSLVVLAAAACAALAAGLAYHRLYERWALKKARAALAGRISAARLAATSGSR